MCDVVNFIVSSINAKYSQFLYNKVMTCVNSNMPVVIIDYTSDLYSKIVRRHGGTIITITNDNQTLDVVSDRNILIYQFDKNFCCNSMSINLLEHHLFNANKLNLFIDNYALLLRNYPNAVSFIAKQAAAGHSLAIASSDPHIFNELKSKVGKWIAFEVN